MRRLALAVTLLILTASCGSRVRDWDEQLAAQQQGTPVTQSTDGSRDDADEDDDTTQTTRRASTGDARRTTTTGKSVANTGPIPSPKPGVYIYDESSEGTDEDGKPQRQTAVARETWRVTSASKSEVVSTSTRRSDEEEEDGASRTTKLRTTPDKQVIVSSVDSYEGEDEESVCTYKPPLTRVMLPLKVGTAWNIESSCKSDGVEQKVTSDARISGEADVMIGGQRVHTFVITATETLTQTFEDESTDPTAPESEPVTFGYMIKRTSHIDPTSLLTVLDEEEIRIRFDAFDGEEAEEVTDVIKIRRQLRSLTPR